jgi:tRNA pseudouridine13 synthase
MESLRSQWREVVLRPPLETSALPGIGGCIRSRDEDFFVDEIPAYAPDGTVGAHLLFQIEKRGIDTPRCISEICAQVGVTPADVGVAGRKDRHAVTRQWLSLPADCEAELGRFEHEQIRVLDVQAHSAKLRRGHNLGNRFRIVVRDLAEDVAVSVERAQAKFRSLERGVLNAFGPQRFGRDGANIESGLELLKGGRTARPDVFLLSAAQSTLFNLHLARRYEMGIVDHLLGGELVRRTDTGGMFTADDVIVEQPRLGAGELVITGPLFGSKMREPTDESPAAKFEAEELARMQISPDAIRSFGKRLPGTRRPLRAPILGARVDPVPAEKGLSEGLCLRFALPSGTYATQVLAEIQRGAGVEEAASATARRKEPR